MMEASLQRVKAPDPFMVLPLVVVGIDLLTPFLIWKGVLPPAVRWGSHMAIALMMLISILRMLRQDRIPRLFWLVPAAAVLWGAVAMGRGQGPSATVWGLWQLFQFPLVALFAYTEPRLPDKLAGHLRRALLIVLCVQVLIQLLQFATGMLPGDNLAGFFARKGTATAAVFATLVNCVFLGHWIVSRRWTSLLAAAGLGLLSCVLGEVKIFPFVLASLGLVAAVIYAVRYHRLSVFAMFATLIVVGLLGFSAIYNAIVPGAEKVPFASYLLDPQEFQVYFNFSKTTVASGSRVSTEFGRMYELRLGWESISGDPLTFVFGYGIGTRSESLTLGTTGIVLKSGATGYSSGKSLTVMIQEMGMLGLLVLASLIVWIVVSMSRGLRPPQAPDTAALRYAVILFSLLWPLWLWYTDIWDMRVPMLLYWYLVGYLLAEPRRAELSEPAGAQGFSLQATSTGD